MEKITLKDFMGETKPKEKPFMEVEELVKIIKNIKEKYEKIKNDNMPSQLDAGTYEDGVITTCDEILKIMENNEIGITERDKALLRRL